MDTSTQRLRIQIRGGTVRVKAWRADTREPETWQIDRPDSSVSGADAFKIEHNWDALSTAPHTVTLASLRVLNPTIAVGYGCPELKGDPGTDSEIKETYFWIVNGCPVPIRKGFYSRTGFGWGHIVYRRDVDGLTNHETTEYARNLWQQALGKSPRLDDIDGTGPEPRKGCHHVHYTTPDGKKRTMLVILSDVNYQGDKGTKGILSAYWESGHTDPGANRRCAEEIAS